MRSGANAARTCSSGEYSRRGSTASSPRLIATQTCPTDAPDGERRASQLSAACGAICVVAEPRRPARCPLWTWYTVRPSVPCNGGMSLPGVEVSYAERHVYEGTHENVKVSRQNGEVVPRCTVVRAWTIPSTEISQKHSSDEALSPFDDRSDEMDSCVRREGRDVVDSPAALSSELLGARAVVLAPSRLARPPAKDGEGAKEGDEDMGDSSNVVGSPSLRASLTVTVKLRHTRHLATSSASSSLSEELAAEASGG